MYLQQCTYAVYLKYYKHILLRLPYVQLNLFYTYTKCGFLLFLFIRIHIIPIPIFYVHDIFYYHHRTNRKHAVMFILFLFMILYYYYKIYPFAIFFFFLILTRLARGCKYIHNIYIHTCIILLIL